MLGSRTSRDYGDTVLPAREVDIVAQMLGKACGDLDGAKMQAIEGEHGLFRRGGLSLAPRDRAVAPG